MYLRYIGKRQLSTADCITAERGATKLDTRCNDKQHIPAKQCSSRLARALQVPGAVIDEL